MFPINIPALSPPSCPEARARLLGRSAPPIAANTPITEDALAAASGEYMEPLHCLGTTRITVGEVMIAYERMYAVIFESVLERYYGGYRAMDAARHVPLQNGIRDLTAMTQDAVRDMEQVHQRLDVFELRDQEEDLRLGAIEDRLEAIENRLSDLEGNLVRVRNRERRAFNRNASQRLTQLQPLQLLIKESAQNGRMDLLLLLNLESIERN